MIIISIHGGLGNQMFQYALGRSLSLAHKLPFKIDSSYLRSENQSKRTLRIHKFNINIEEATEKEIAMYKGYLRKIIHRFLPFSKKKTILEELPDFDKKILDKKSGYFFGHWNSEKYFLKYKKVIITDFKLKNPFGLIAMDIFDNICGEQNSVSVHIRRGDYVSIKKITDHHGVLPISYYEQAMNYIKSKFPNTHFFVFSDDIIWVKEHFPKKYNLTFVSDPKIEDCEELILMSKCKHNILANSTFSWWGAWLNQNPEKIIIAPKKWYRDSSISTEDLIPSSWIQL